MSFAIISSAGSAYYVLRGFPPYNASGSAIIWVIFAYVALKYSEKERLQRLGRPIPKNTRAILDLATASAWVWITLTVLAGMDYSLLQAHLTSDLETTMLNDLMFFDGVLIGFVALLTSQDLRDLVKDAEEGVSPPGLRPALFHKRRLVKRRSDVLTLVFLSMGAFGSWLAIPWVAATPNVGYLGAPLQVAVFGIGLLIARMIWYT